MRAEPPISRIFLPIHLSPDPRITFSDRPTAPGRGYSLKKKVAAVHAALTGGRESCYAFNMVFFIVKSRQSGQAAMELMASLLM
ncbi:MAG: hypothetical protein J6334_09905, partial [Kiritimatiellae bacterium]|nr:hypothetical protein [Kiritimatiellia bacterium]